MQPARAHGVGVGGASHGETDGDEGRQGQVVRAEGRRVRNGLDEPHSGESTVEVSEAGDAAAGAAGWPLMGEVTRWYAIALGCPFLWPLWLFWLVMFVGWIWLRD